MAKAKCCSCKLPFDANKARVGVCAGSKGFFLCHICAGEKIERLLGPLAVSEQVAFLYCPS
ncbi:MAG: hypothetical protein ACREKR_12100 [Candidatus Methylomirabilales bacterium]